MSSFYPYADEYPVVRGIPERGRPRDEILGELRDMAHREDASWENGKVSGSMYCGSHEHYEFLNEAFGYYGHMNALQRDVCPSSTRFEGEIIAMGLDLMHAGTVTGTTPVGLVTSGGSGSILHAMLSYREDGARRGIDRPNVVKPETAHPAFDKACHLLGIELRIVPIDPVSTQVDLDAVRDAVDAEHGRPRRIGRQLRLRHDRPDRGARRRSRSNAASACTSTAAWVGSSCRGASSSATTSHRSTSACPA